MMGPQRCFGQHSSLTCAWIETNSDINRVEVVSAPASSGIDFGGNRVDALTVNVESMKNIDCIGLQVRLHLPQCIFHDEERALHRAVISPEADRAPRRIVTAAAIWKIDRHGVTRKTGSRHRWARELAQCASLGQAALVCGDELRE